MASLSLPRVLQLKKNSLDAEREQFEKFQSLAISKAINSVETPVKEKHVRSTIIGTFQEQSAITYWMVAIRLPLQDNRIVAWKFCHVTHKLLREGHPACLDDSQRHITMIENLGKLWVHLREGYGRLVSLYCNLLVTKLKFHARNPRFPGNMQLTADELDNIAENDVNNYFQLCVELFDYMDDILSLQAAVFDSLGNARANSMTASGQCRLAALIPCAQDSSHIYDTNVRLLFRLHAALPPDTLAGHRERFRQQFKKLSQFYKHASSLQYYRNLLSLPVLPSNPPNFLLQSDFGTYVTPVVSIPEPPPDEVDAVGSLIDTSDTISQFSQATTPDHVDAFDTRTTPSPQPDPVVERDRLIDHLQNELRRMRSEASQLVQERNSMLGTMKEHCVRLEAQLHAAKTELEEEKQRAEQMSFQTPEIQKKLTETEEKAKVIDEKFQKLKSAYTQLREEHISLIRQKAEVDKTAANLRAATAQQESAKAALQQQLNDKLKDMELLQQSASSSEEIEAYKTEIANLRAELEQSRQRQSELQTLKAAMEALEIEHKTATTEQEEKLTTVSNELKDVMDNLEKIKLEKEQRENELNLVKTELVGLREKSGDEYKKVLEEKEAALRQVSELTQQYQQEKQEQLHCIKELQAELETLQLTLTDVNNNFALQCKQITSEFEAKNKQLELHLLDKDSEVKKALDQLIILQSELEKTKQNYELKVDEKDVVISQLQQKINELNLNTESYELAVKQLEDNNYMTNVELDKANIEISRLLNVLSEKEVELSNVGNLVKELETNIGNQKIVFSKSEENKNEEILELRAKLEVANEEKTCNIKKLEKVLEEETKSNITLQTEMEKLLKIIADLENSLMEKNKEIDSFKSQLHDVTNTLKEDKLALELQLQENENKVKFLNEKVKTVTECKDEIIKDLKEMISEKDKQVITINIEVNKLSEKISTLQEELKEAEAELEIGKNEFFRLRDEHENIVLMNDKNIALKNQELRSLQDRVQEFSDEKAKWEKERKNISDDFALEKQLLEARLEHTESKRVNAECELQDLLQHNQVLEADLGALKKQLEETQKMLEQQNAKLVSCTSEAAITMTNDALAALERSNAQDTNRGAADLAAEALEDLARHTEVKGNEESVARNAIFAAHNTASLSAYVTEVCNTSTDMELSEKLSNECRTMLTATKTCLESLKNGSVQAPICTEARGHVKSLLQAAAAADRLNSGARSVDDELADMDKAIEQAASQIEKMLAASKAGDSGVKLEVNGKILDACTTLMGAVKMLVQDARKLQNELGDPKTRQKMYRRNPQWSEGLISAAKAVVFAAKLLVSSADEAVGAAGRVEGVSAAAHEVAGSTAQLVAASRARAPPSSPALARLTQASRSVAAATGAVVAAVRAGSALVNEQEALDTSALTLTATRRLEMESKVRSLELEVALDAERTRLAALRKRHYQLAQMEENGNMTNGKQ